MTGPAFVICPETPADAPVIEALLDRAFGLGRHTKTSYRLREGSRATAGLSFTARSTHDDALIGAISFWPLKIGKAGTPALLLGPLAVDPDHQNEGIGLALMKTGLNAARAQGHQLVILVGDAPYYARVGFAPVPPDQLTLPGPVDPNRLLALEFTAGARAEAKGLVVPPGKFGI